MLLVTWQGGQYSGGLLDVRAQLSAINGRFSDLNDLTNQNRLAREAARQDIDAQLRDLSDKISYDRGRMDADHDAIMRLEQQMDGRAKQ